MVADTLISNLKETLEDFGQGCNTEGRAYGHIFIERVTLGFVVISILVQQNGRPWH